MMFQKQYQVCRLKKNRHVTSFGKIIIFTTEGSRVFSDKTLNHIMQEISRV